MWRTICVLLLMLTLAGAAWAQEQAGDPDDDKVRLIPPPDSPAATIVPYGPESGLDRELWIGNKAPDFKLNGSQGRPVRLADLKGQWAVLIFAEARASFRGLVGIDGDLARLGVHPYGVCQDGASALKAYAAREQLSFVLLSDPTRQISQTYGMYDGDSDAIQPGIVLLDPRGVVRMTLLAQSLHSTEILQVVKQAVTAGAPVDSATVSPGAASVLHERHRQEYRSAPILIAGTETRSTRLGPPGPRGTIEFQFGPVMASLLGFSLIAPYADGGVDAIRDASTTIEHDDYSGAGLEFSLGRPSGLYLDGGRVTLREPLDVLEYGDSNSEYWTTSAGIDYRF